MWKITKKDLNMMEEIINEELESLRKDFEKNTKVVEELRKYDLIEFGEFGERTYICQGKVVVSLEEEELKKAINHFRPQFSGAGHIQNVWHYIGEKFSVIYGFSEDFTIHIHTTEPKKYLSVDCKVVDKVEKAIICERGI